MIAAKITATTCQASLLLFGCVTVDDLSADAQALLDYMNLDCTLATVIITASDDYMVWIHPPAHDYFGPKPASWYGRKVTIEKVEHATPLL